MQTTKLTPSKRPLEVVLSLARDHAKVGAKGAGQYNDFKQMLYRLCPEISETEYESACRKLANIFRV